MRNTHLCLLYATTCVVINALSFHLIVIIEPIDSKYYIDKLFIDT